jgi:hypothetical protein
MKSINVLWLVNRGKNLLLNALGVVLTRELGMTTVDLARMLNLAQPTVSQVVIREQKIAENQGLSLL